MAKFVRFGLKLLVNVDRPVMFEVDVDRNWPMVDEDYLVVVEHDLGRSTFRTRTLGPAAYCGKVDHEAREFLRRIEDVGFVEVKLEGERQRPWSRWWVRADTFQLVERRGGVLACHHETGVLKVLDPDGTVEVALLGEDAHVLA